MFIRKKDHSHQTLQVIADRCPQNHRCPSVAFCPSGAITQTGYDAPTIDPSLCTKCGRCLKTCPHRVFQFS